MAPDFRHLLLAARAEACHLNKEYDRSVDDADRALAYYPERTRILVWRAYTHNALGNRQASDADFEQALHIDEYDTYVLYY